MQITITARHFELTNAIRDFVEQSCEKLSRYFDHIISVDAILTLEKMRNHVEFNLHASKFNLHSEHEDMDLYVAVEAAVEKMERQLKKLKDKVTDHQKMSIRKNPNFFYANTFERNAQSSKNRMIKTKRVQAETMSVTDAIDSLISNETPYMIFKNMETDRVNVLVKKGDLFKLIEP